MLQKSYRTSGKRSGCSKSRSGTFEKRSGCSENRSGTSEKRSGRSENRSGTSEKRSGCSENRSGTSEKRSGCSENRSGTSGKRSGGSGSLAGPPESVSGLRKSFPGPRSPGFEYPLTDNHEPPMPSEPPRRLPLGRLGFRARFGRPMSRKRAVLEHLKKDELLDAVDRFELEVGDRRVREGLVDALAGSRRGAPAEILGDLSRDRLKEICRALRLDDSGREKAGLIARLAGEAPAPVATAVATAPAARAAAEAAPSSIDRTPAPR